MALSQWKEAILEGIYTEIEEGIVEEKTLERLENLVEILHKEGSKVPESVKESYRRVAVECTARRLKDAKEAYDEVFRSIWLRRVMPLCDEVSCLVTHDLFHSCKRVWTAHGDAKACERLVTENTREKALASLREVVSELHPNIDNACGDINESSQETEDTEAMTEEREIDVNQNMDEDKDWDKATEPMTEERERDVNQNSLDEDKDWDKATEPMTEERENIVDEDKDWDKATEPMTEERENIVDEDKDWDKVTEPMTEERENTMDVVDKDWDKVTEPMTEERERDVNQMDEDRDWDKVTEPMTEERENTMDVHKGNEEERPSDESPPRRMKTISSAVVDKALKELRASKIDLMNALAEAGGPSNLNVASTTQQENDVANPAVTNKRSFMDRQATGQTHEWEDSIDDSDGENGEANKKPRRIVVSPLKRNLVGGRRPKIPWSTAETKALMEGYEKYGAQWKRIKNESDILVRRTNTDIKDKFRVVMRRQERHPLSRRS